MGVPTAIPFSAALTPFLRRRGRHEQVDVIGHQTTGPDLNPYLARLFREQIEIDFMVPVLEEDRLAPVSPLGHMMREAGKHPAGKTGHAGT